MLSLFRHIIKYTHLKMAIANLATRMMLICRYLINGRPADVSHPAGAFENRLGLLEINNHLTISIMNDMSTVTEYLEQEPNTTSFEAYLRPDCLFSSGLYKFAELTEYYWLLSHIDLTVIDKLRNLDSKAHCVFIGSLQCEDDTAQLTIYKGVEPDNEYMPVHVYYHSNCPILFAGTFEFHVAWDGRNKLLTSSLIHENSFRIDA
mgnify:CR=1 FL=1